MKGASYIILFGCANITKRSPFQICKVGHYLIVSQKYLGKCWANLSRFPATLYRSTALTFISVGNCSQRLKIRKIFPLHGAWENKARCFAGEARCRLLFTLQQKLAPVSNRTVCRNWTSFVSVLWGSEIASFSLTSAPSLLHFECFEAFFATHECSTRLWRRLEKATCAKMTKINFWLVPRL